MSDTKYDPERPKKIVDRKQYSQKIDTSKVDNAGFDEVLTVSDLVFSVEKDLRYGQNPEQAAVRFIQAGLEGASLMTAPVIYTAKKGLSFINYTDANSALRICDLLGDKDTAVVVPVKHSTPSGVGLDYSGDLIKAYEQALKGDQQSIFGCSMAVNKTVDEDFIKALGGLLMEVLVAPKFTEQAIEYVKANKKSSRLVELGEGPISFPRHNIVAVSGGFLMEEFYETRITSPENLEAITETKPTDDHIRAGLVAWKIAGQVKSNAIVLVSPDGTSTYGIGTGQMSRVDSADMAVRKALKSYDGGSLKTLEGAVAASDAFFPFPDAAERLVIPEEGIRGVDAIVYPLGSVKDKDTIAMLNEYGRIGLCTRPEPGTDKIERAFSGHAS